MNLSECKIGTVVIMRKMCGDAYENIGHIVGLTYNVRLNMTGSMDFSELRERTIPIVRFPDGERSVHHCNLEIYNDYKNYN